MVIGASHPAQGPRAPFRLELFRCDYTVLVYTITVKNITLSAEESLIEQARSVAKSQQKTLNSLFRQWLRELTTQHGDIHSYDALMARLGHVRAGRRFNRDEMNER